MSKVLFPEYNVDYISNVMSLRKPQKQSVKILNDILDDIELSKNIDLKAAESDIHDVYQIFKSFDGHDFMSLTFALATGVGKTKLMGAFITYLYTQKGIRNFFVVAPSLTIYEKLKNDLGNSSPDNIKYVFSGVSCFAVNRPNIICEDDYKKPLLYKNNSGVNIFIFNIAKFNTEDRAIKNLNEFLGQSFFEYLCGLNDLVVIMDESHHYRASQSAKSINDLKPVLGLELTATPQVEKNGKPVLFENVVYEYPLYKAIKDGYTRTPYALTRKNFNAYNFDDEQLDKTMINDGILHHENVKVELEKYAINNGVRRVKPFVLIVCKNTEHAELVLNYIKSDNFKLGAYKDKVVLIHSNQRGQEKEENVSKLLEIENADNPIEIVIHVNMLKEGWDVNNLYTIIPLRTATSKTLREQTVGRGLRLPYGVRTGDELVDSVTITAHDKFDEIIQEAQKGDSIFNAEGVIYADYLESKKIVVTQPCFEDITKMNQVLAMAGCDVASESSQKNYQDAKKIVDDNLGRLIKQNPLKRIQKQEVIEIVKQDLAQNYANNTELSHIVEAYLGFDDDYVDKYQDSEMYLPKIRTEKIGNETYVIQDFDLELTPFDCFKPIENELVRKNLIKSMEDEIVTDGGVVDFDTIRPEKHLVDGIRNVSEIDYEKCPEVIQKVVTELLTYYRGKYTEKEVRNICVMNRMGIINNLKDQILKHLEIKYEGLIEEVCGIETLIRRYAVESTKQQNINIAPEVISEITKYAFNGAKKSVTDWVKFDSEPERKFALVCDNSPEVKQWLRPAPKQFNITYNHGRRYEPDFVVETNDMYYLVEVKGRDRLTDPDVISKKECGVKYCKMASEYNKAHNHKQFKYLFIPHDEISLNSSFNNLKNRFAE